jgi:hypothetical protein
MEFGIVLHVPVVGRWKGDKTVRQLNYYRLEAGRFGDS